MYCEKRFRYFEYVETGNVNLVEFQELKLGSRGNWGPWQVRSEAGRTDETVRNDIHRGVQRPNSGNVSN